MKKLKYFIPMIIWMIFIFIMSHTDGNQSSLQSGFFVDLISKIIKIDQELLSLMIRKAAHMSEYAFLALTVFYGLYQNKFNQKLLLPISLLISFLYACSDEFHQLFIAGRSGQFIDVLIDTSGALIMIMIIYWWLRKKKSTFD